MQILAYLFAILKSVIYGSTIFFTGRLTESADVLDILALRFLLSFAVLWVLKYFRLVKIRISVKDFFVKNPRTPYIKELLLAALFEPVLYMLFETLGISMTTGITAGVILSLGPIATCIVETAVLKEKATLWQKIFLGLGILGAVYIALNTKASDGKDSVWGIVFVLLAVVTGALFAAFSRKSSSAFSSMEITYVSCLLGMVAFNLANVVRHLAAGTITAYFAPYCNWDNMVGFVFLSIISTIIAVGMNNFALARIQISTMAAFGGISTLVTVAVGVIFGGEKLQAFHLIGLSLILVRMIGVSYIAIQRDKGHRNKEPEEFSFFARLHPELTIDKGQKSCYDKMKK